MAMKRKLLCMLLVLCAPVLVFAQYRASIIETTGKVEIKAPGSSSWESAVIGDVVEAGTIISTGLRSTAVLLMGNTRLNVRALTRLSLRELRESQDTVNTDLFLTVGKVGADVKPMSGKVQTFTIASPVATASVRGTSFEFDGVTVEVKQGQVNMGNKLGFQVPVAGGEGIALNSERLTATIPTVLDNFVAQNVSVNLANEFVRLPPTVAQQVAAVVSAPPPIDPRTATVLINIVLPE
jgi:hypothetical protein